MKMTTRILGLLTMVILASCSTSNDVVGNRSIQKRKYNDGYYIAWKKNYSKSGSEKTESVLDSMQDFVVSDETEFAENETIQAELAAVETLSGETTLEAISNVPLSSIPDPVIVEENAAGENQTTNPLARVLEHKSVRRFLKPGRQQVISGSVETESSASSAAGVNVILLVILALFIPPLAVFLFEGATGRFWIDLILALVGWGVGWWLLGNLAWICSLVAVIYAILIILGIV